MRYFEDLVEGEVFEFRNYYTVHQEEIKEIASRFDPQPFHLDEKAAEESIFGSLTASSVHLFAMMVGIGTTDTEHEKINAVSALGFDKLRVTHPARPGDVLWVRSTITSLRQSKSRPDCGIVVSFSEMLNQDDITVMSMEQAYLAACRP